MNRIIVNLGLWSSVLCLTSLIVWVISFIGIAILSPLFYWTNVEDYAYYIKTNDQFFQYLAKSFMIIFSLAYMIVIIVFYEFTTNERKILSKIALVFSVMFAMVSSIHYFVQISSVRFAIAQNEFDGLAHFLQSNPSSFLSSLNMLGWTLFLGLSSFFTYLGLTPGARTKGLRSGFLISAISCIFGGIGYLAQIDRLTFISINLGVGVALFVIAISSLRYFLCVKTSNI